jgi:hypothetical protein
MKPTEANAMAKRLKGLLPTMTPEQIVYWAETFEQYSAPAATAAIEQYVREYRELYTPRLRAILRLKSIDPEVGQSLAAAQRREAREKDLYWERVAQTIDSLDEQRLEQLKARVIESQQPSLPIVSEQEAQEIRQRLRSFFASKDPRRQRRSFLRSAIAELAWKEAAHVQEA